MLRLSFIMCIYFAIIKQDFQFSYPLDTHYCKATLFNRILLIFKSFIYYLNIFELLSDYLYTYLRHGFKFSII